MSDVVVVGAGVTGLSCAVRLLEAGHRVRVWARDLPLATTSVVAAAIWYPYRAQPAERVLGWSTTTLAELTRLSGEPRTGVRLRPGLEVFRRPAADPWWRTAVPSFRRAAPDELPAGFVDGWAMELPVADMPAYLTWLVDRLQALGGGIDRREVTDLGEALAAAPVVVNASGIGARELVPDPSMSGLRGQVVRVAAPAVDRFLLHDEDDPVITYVVPRRDEVVLGGTAEPAEPGAGAVPDPVVAAAIRARCEALEPRLVGAPVVSEAVGLRPCRPAVRLEDEAVAGGVVVHDYGHGGAGVTLSWGCADEVVRLVDVHVGR